MGKSQIIEKLSKKLSESLSSEADVVYVLSRTRKIIEIDNLKESYGVLNFYCNFALHSKIDRIPKKIHDMFIKIKDGGVYPNNYTKTIIGFEDFHKDFQKFIKEKELPEYIYKTAGEIKKFNNLLTAIYSDTPVTIIIEKYIATINSTGIISIEKK